MLSTPFSFSHQGRHCFLLTSFFFQYLTACINGKVFLSANILLHAVHFLLSLLLFSSTHFRTFISFQTSFSHKKEQEHSTQKSETLQWIGTARTCFCSILFLFSDAFVFASLFRIVSVGFLAVVQRIEHYIFGSLSRFAHCLDTTSLMFSFLHLWFHTFVIVCAQFFASLLLVWFSRHNGDRTIRLHSKK